MGSWLLRYQRGWIAALAALTMLMLSACMLNTGKNEFSLMSMAELDQTDPDEVLDDEASLTYWAGLSNNAASIKSNLEDIPFFQEWKRRTGVNLTYINPPLNQGKEAFNVMIASGHLPDMIEYEWMNYPGGPEKAIHDGIILRLNELVEEHAPHFKQFLEDHPDIDRQIKTADGSYYAFPFIQADDKLRTYQGPILRKDWLDELRLPVPETIEEWHAVLTAFKEHKGAPAPLTILGNSSPLSGIEGGGFVGAYGIRKGFYMEEGIVKFGPMEPEYKQFLALFQSWYAEGLIDKHFATTDTETQDMNMTMERSGAAIWNAGAGIGTWLPKIREETPSAELIAAPYPVLREGMRPKFGQLAPVVGSSGGVALSGSIQNAEAAVRMLDYGYGEEGHLLFNFGIEGLSYEMIDGYPTYTDLILNNKDKLSPSQALAMYTRASYFGPFVQDIRYLEQYYTLPEQKEAIQIWADTDASLHLLPALPKSEMENAELSAIMQEVNKHVDAVSLKMIMGIEPLSEFDSYIQQLKSMNIEQAIAIQQQALDRYNSSVCIP
ncbi:extracellular solute-binding protein [Paenibacillus sp. 453mf]|uniref:extracellular solute-binding protein n=1 Tax=Paenibacillus sp. 453mf TaxID=1761874 RepID=UPI0008F2CF13|nr:extracellular solute-binding protein [Paenibacillus sp. 453mf]SFS86842.1 putative aldouronate transport system substrate-binding protein [Paenibacillus sp. 453mf]